LTSSGLSSSITPALADAATTSVRRPWLAWAGALVILAGALRLVLWYWPGAVPLDVTSGVWTALAKDFAEGVLYRPLLGPAGYGGTRYMPLFFLTHGALIRLGADPIAAGLCLTLVSAVLFDLALCFTLRECGVRASLAVPLSLLAHATVSVQLLTLATKCDLLAAALNLGAVGAALRHSRRPRRRTLTLVVLAASAAFLTKLTAVGGAVSALALLRSRRGWRPAIAAAIALASMLLSAGAGLFAASDGRVWTSMRAVGSGGIGWLYAVRFPLWFARAIVEDPFSLLIFLTALFYAVRETRRRHLAFAVAYFWLTLAVTVPVFASPGTDNNHLIDLLAASILLLGHASENAAEGARLATLLPAALAGLTALTWLPGMPSVGSVIAQMGRPERRTITAIVERAGSADRILSENPLIPVLAGGRPFVSDAFSLRILATQRPELRADFARSLAGGEFPTVVLEDWSGADASRVMAALRSRTDRGVEHFYGDVRFTPDFLDRIERDYVVSRVEHPFVVFERRPRPPS